jgi:hypothetical protein
LSRIILWNPNTAGGNGDLLRGSPWASLTFLTPAVMGRSVPPGMMLALPALWAIHLVVSVAYGLLISVLVSKLRAYKAILTGGLIGLVLYMLNWCVVRAVWPAWKVDEIPVVFTHIVFGLVAAGAYRGLLRRRPATEGG